MTTRTDSDAKQKVWEMIRDIQVALMVSRGADGHMHGRPMAGKAEMMDDTLWFFTRAETEKVEEIRADPQVLLSYSDPAKQNYVAIAGLAEIVRDRDEIKRLWSEPMRTWFPKGSDDPDIELIKVTVEGAEYWDAPSSTMVYAWGYAKARLTGKSPNSGESAKVDFSRG